MMLPSSLVDNIIDNVCLAERHILKVDTPYLIKRQLP